MKSSWIKFISFVLTIFLLTGCIGNSTNKEGVNIRSTYPSQFLVGDVYALKEHEKIDGNIAGIGTTLIIEEGATVAGDISLVGSQMEISGRIEGDINVFAGTSHFHQTAIISGSVNQISHQVKIEPGAHIAGKINTFVFPAQSGIKNSGEFENILEWLRPTGLIVFQMIRSLILVFISVLIIFLFKIPTLRIASFLKKNIIISWGVGSLVILATPLVSLFLIITICLSPIGIILMLAFLIADIWGFTGISFVIGANLTRWLKLEWSEEAQVASGSVVLGMVSTLLAFLPFIGFIVSLIMTAVGLGSIILSKFGTIEKGI